MGVFLEVSRLEVVRAEVLWNALHAHLNAFRYSKLSYLIECKIAPQP